ncbi:MAG TPA: di-trans,poly-cis-decaprenylcistransferase [Bacteroidetes bacterium]|nr:di-trans,poly-cis-decaprenylcistransferase [Bacteroidota bacterium]
MPLVHATGIDKKHQDRLKQSGAIPVHIAVIMDGNGRWAKRRGLPRIAGHNEGVNSVRDIVEACGQLGVQYLTLYAFSTENWKRPKDEVSLLMRLLLRALRDERDRLHQNEVRLKAVGDIDALPSDVREELLKAIEMMRNNTGLTLNLALSYSGRWDLTGAMRRLAQDVRAGVVHPETINEATIAQYLSTREFPDPDLLIRTSGEHRISNFLLWELAYSEMVFADEYWPSFRRKHLYAAVADFQKRERRYGMVSEQVQQPRFAPAQYVERFLKSVAKL